jgi:hypothetical protein
MPGAAIRAFRAFACVALLSLAALSGSGECLAQTDAQIAEYRVKAAFLYKFGDYIEWPGDAFARPDSAVVIGVMGADVLADELGKIVAGRTIAGRPVTVRKLRRGDALAGLHLLFVGRSEGSRLADLFAETKGHAILTVTESDQAASPGSVINFVVVDDKVRFDIALQPAEQGNLKISSRLLAIARRVATRPS